MKALVVSILVNGIHDGFLEYRDCTWDVCRDLVDAKLFPEDDKWSVRYDAERYARGLGEEYTYEIKTVTLTFG
jgi:hypothetical protein